MLSDFYTNFHQGGIDNSELGVEQPEEQNCVYNFRHNSRKVIDNAENTFSLEFSVHKYSDYKCKNYSEYSRKNVNTRVFHTLCQ